MRKFCGFYKNKSFSVGCSGETVYIYDNNGKELKRFKDFSYAYNAVFMPNTNIIAVKSTEGCIGFYDLEKLSLIKKHKITTIGGQDEGFAFSSNGKFFYNIEKPVTTSATQIGIYETITFTKINTLFADDKKMVLDFLEIDETTGYCYVLGFMRDVNSGVFDYGFAAVFDEEKLMITNIHALNRTDYKYVYAYKKWELSGFTDRSLEWNDTLNELEAITPISIKEIFENANS